MKPYEVHEGDLLVSTNPALLDRAVIHQWLSESSYWAKGIPPETVDRSIENSLSFGIYRDGKMAGFARVVTDFSTFAWLADVFILEEHRSAGLGKKLVAAILKHPGLQGLRRFMLATWDAHGLYKQFGFTQAAPPERFMEIFEPNPYGAKARQT